MRGNCVPNIPKMWTCPCCKLHNYEEDYNCKACYSPHFQYSELVQIVKDQQMQIKELSKEIQSKTIEHETEINRLNMIVINSNALERDSIQTVHNNMLTKLFDAQDELDEKEERLLQQINYLENNMSNKTMRLLTGYPLDQIIPQYLNKEMRLIYRLLFDGYSKQYHSNIPHNVNQLISYFFPIFSVDYIPYHYDHDNDRVSSIFDNYSDHNENASTHSIIHINTNSTNDVHTSTHSIEENNNNEETKEQFNNRMFQTLLDAEFEYEEEIERLYKEKGTLEENMASYKAEIRNDFVILDILCKYSIRELIPKQLNESTKSQFKMLFCGYMRTNYENQVFVDIVDTIVSFYPIINCSVSNAM
eukprot:77704_1